MSTCGGQLNMIFLLVCLLPTSTAFTADMPNALSVFQATVSHESSSHISVHSLDGFLHEFLPEDSGNIEENKKKNARKTKTDEQLSYRSSSSSSPDAALSTTTTSKSRFAAGEELESLRMDLESLRENLQWALALEDTTTSEDLRKAIQNGENRDPDAVFKRACKEMTKAKDNKLLTVKERDALIQKWTGVAEEARGYLPQFSLEGLWVGDYGSQGYQLINVTYDGDTLIGTKVTGDVNVPRGEASFTANLSLKNGTDSLPPIPISLGGSRSGVLGAAAAVAAQRGALERFPGEGQISRKGFKDPRNVEGQLLLMDERRFSFLWVPTKHHIHFTRPSPKVTMRLLRDVLSKEDEVENMRNHVARCFEMDLSTCIARQHNPNTQQLEPFRRIPTQGDLEKAEKLSKKDTHSKHSFWQLKKWRNYIDQVLDGEPLQ